MKITETDVEMWLEYHSLTPEARAKCAKIMEAGQAFAKVILATTFSGPDQSAAIRKVREASMTANASIACEPENWAGATDV